MYSEASTGRLISQRLIDPHDSDQTAEEKKKACVTWLVEEALTQTVQVRARMHALAWYM